MIVTMPLSFMLAKVVQLFLDLFYGPTNEHYKLDGVFCYDVLLDIKQQVIQPNNIHLFLKKFRKVDDISVISESGVTLHSITKRDFIFVRCTQGSDLYNSNLHPIFFIVQHETAFEVMTVPHKTVFKYMAARQWPPHKNSSITLLYNISRCGSTLITSMVNKTRQKVVISEPYALINLAEIINTPNKHVTQECTEYYEIIRTTLILLAKDSSKSYFIKVPGIITGSLLHLVHKAMPGVRELFLYRALKPTLSSFRRMVGPAYFWVIAEILLLGHPMKYRDIWQQVKVWSPHKKIMYQFLCQMHPFYIEARTRDNIKSYSYESLIKDERSFCESFLTDIGIGLEFVSIALSALEKDSQENSPISRKRLVGRRGEVPLQACLWAQGVAKEQFGIQLEGEDFMITNFPNSWESYRMLQSNGYGTF